MLGPYSSPLSSSITDVGVAGAELAVCGAQGLLGDGSKVGLDICGDSEDVVDAAKLGVTAIQALAPGGVRGPEAGRLQPGNG